MSSARGGLPPSILSGDGTASLCELFQQTAAARGDAPALRLPDGTISKTWAQYAQAVKLLAAGLAGLGIGRGDVVALMMGNRPEFHLVDTATLHLGATAFSIYTTFTEPVVAHLLANSGARVVICADEHLDTISAAKPPSVEHVITLDRDDPRARTLDALSSAREPGFDFVARWSQVSAEDVATLIYTSGTTGPPKGVELTHGNILAELRATAQVLPIEPGDTVPSAFPMAHAAERWGSHYQAIAHGLDVTCVPDLKQLPMVVATMRPHIWGSVPRIWEKLYSALQAGIDADPDEHRRSALREALDTGLTFVRAQQASVCGEGPGPDQDLAARHAAADRQVLSELRQRIGLDRVRWAVVGSAPTPLAVLEFFAAIGIPLCEVWGMSELSCVATVNPPHGGKLGTVGRIVPGSELRLADDGEIEVRGPIVMRGYRGEPEKTAHTMTADGWLKTGDIGTLDRDGFLRIVDRKKELIITAAGKNLSPTNIEAAVKSSDPLIGQVVAIGDGRSYVTALIVLDCEYAAATGVGNDPRALANDTDVLARVHTAVSTGNRQLARVEQIKRHVVLPESWEPGSELLTPTLKLKRKPIAERYADHIEALYSAARDEMKDIPTA